MLQRNVSRTASRAPFAVAVAFLLTGVSPARAVFIVNGGFELPNLVGAPFSPPIGVGNPAIPGWQVVAGNVEVVSRAFSAPFE